MFWKISDKVRIAWCSTRLRCNFSKIFLFWKKIDQYSTEQLHNLYFHYSCWKGEKIEYDIDWDLLRAVFPGICPRDSFSPVILELNCLIIYNLEDPFPFKFDIQKNCDCFLNGFFSQKWQNSCLTNCDSNELKVILLFFYIWWPTK